ncbi:hypothetical protein NCG89_04405 [Spongiibacter taiwanensis]|uniref:hypothetical protein n=1 Tax=Spongiibacter taiwanensis TaxID=1748242 RepID=UPI002035DC59|nr:hypothetical protein [Spongiibacter taiwanensis]USA44025.1 hypothetical protein NCG89_04405 [Spongiibacter taiwanensis]
MIKTKLLIGIAGAVVLSGCTVYPHGVGYSSYERYRGHYHSYGQYYGQPYHRDRIYYYRDRDQYRRDDGHRHSGGRSPTRVDIQYDRDSRWRGDDRQRDNHDRDQGHNRDQRDRRDGDRGKDRGGDRHPLAGDRDRDNRFLGGHDRGGRDEGGRDHRQNSQPHANTRGRVNDGWQSKRPGRSLGGSERGQEKKRTPRIFQ